VRKHIKADLLTYPSPSPECAGSGYIQAWAVAKSYRITANGLLCEDESAGWTRSYNPFCEWNLPTALARVATGTSSPLEFAAEFGLLGYDHLRLPKEPRGGEPIEWILAHSRTVRFCLDWIGMFEEGDTFVIEDALKHQTSGRYAWGAVSGNLKKRDMGLSAGVVRRRVASFITENIRGITRRMETDLLGTRARSLFTFRGMIETIYWQLANKLDQGGIRRCNACRSIFVARDKRQNYCPAFPNATRSRCSSKLNTANFRNRQG
jgi:hypothetical protein